MYICTYFEEQEQVDLASDAGEGFPEILMGWLRFGAATLMCQELEY